jgi:uncharacterized protein (DUF952 family)
VNPLFHIVAPDVWAAAQAAGAHRPASLSQEGFVHLSFADQVEGVANARYADAPELVVLELDEARISVPVVVEDSYGSGTAYPHVYAALDPAWVVAVHPLRRESGAWRFSPRGGTAPASPDR